MSFRRFVNLVSSDSLKGVYSLRRIDMSRFFLPELTTNGTMAQQQDSASCLLPLPDPDINFYSPEDVNGCGNMDFMLVHDKVVATDGTGGAFIYDTGKHAVRSLPGSHAPFETKYAVSLTVGSDVYLIDRLTNGWTRKRNFEALVYRPGDKRGNWHWRALPPPPPPPPGVREPEDDRTNIESCAAFADGSRIWMSASSRGRGAVGAVEQRCTHLFDTEGLVWSKQPADWLLPFTGSAQYVPELQKLWFGISSRDHGHAFCAADLATASLSRPPVLRNVFDDDMAPAGAPDEDRCLMMANAVHLGSGRFCIARFFRVLKKPDGCCGCRCCSKHNYDEELFVVVAGVEVVSGGDGELSLVKHRSERYLILDYELHWVL